MSATLATTPVRVGGLWVVPPLLLVGGIFFYPLALIVGQSLVGAAGGVSLATYGAVLAGPQFANALWHTIEIAVGATAGCLLLGFVMALLLTFVPIPGGRLIARLIDTFIALPTFLVALAFTFIYGSAGLLNMTLMAATGQAEPPIDFLYSVWGVILAEVTVYTPFIMRPLLAAFSLIDPAQIEVASSLGAGAWRIIRQVIFPAALPALLAGGSLCLLLTVNEFGVVFFIGAKGVTTLPLLVYGRAIEESDYTSACAIAVVNIALSLALYAVYRTLVGRLGANVLVWSSGGRAWAWGVLLGCFGLVYVVPLAMIALASVAGEWNGVLPKKLTFVHFARALSGEAAEQLRASIVTGAVASLIALVAGTWAALALRTMVRLPRRVLDTLFFVPSAVPSVSVGLGLLVAFSRKPFLLNGTTAIVVIAHLVLISAFAYGNVSAGLSRLPGDVEQVAESLGATPGYRLRRVTLPLLTPYLIAAFSLSFAMSMGELGATVMVYPPGWVTLPVGIFALTDRGAVFDGAALTVMLALTTLAVLFGLSRVPSRATTR